MTTVPIFTDPLLLTQDELKQAIEQFSKSDIPLTTIENPEKFRGILSDPNVLAAIIEAGGAVITALIGAFALIYTSRKDKGETNGEGAVIININSTSDKLPESKIVIPLDNLNLEAYKAKVEELELRPEIIENINYSEEP